MRRRKRRHSGAVMLLPPWRWVDPVVVDGHVLDGLGGPVYGLIRPI